MICKSWMSCTWSFASLLHKLELAFGAALQFDRAFNELWSDHAIADMSPICADAGHGSMDDKLLLESCETAVAVSLSLQAPFEPNLRCAEADNGLDLKPILEFDAMGMQSIASLNVSYPTPTLPVCKSCVPAGIDEVWQLALESRLHDVICGDSDRVTTASSNGKWTSRLSRFDKSVRLVSLSLLPAFVDTWLVVLELAWGEEHANATGSAFNAVRSNASTARVRSGVGVKLPVQLRELFVTLPSGTIRKSELCSETSQKPWSTMCPVVSTTYSAVRLSTVHRCSFSTWRTRSSMLASGMSAARKAPATDDVLSRGGTSTGGYAASWHSLATWRPRA
mmetsp:Transcript_25987/g.73433  ORF Transcript_25987/g.73433 Transcript_25987/m.73433 type:complete len:337 (-) Transcript_25987:467-1477(-)